MDKFFNTAGPTKPDLHYHLDPLHRLDWDEIQHLIATQRYFVLHAPRQTGKTTTLLAMMKELNASGRYACAYANIEGAQAARGDETQGIPAACDAITTALSIYLQDDDPKQWLEQNLHKPAQNLLSDLLTHWTRNSSKPTVLLLDEVDALVGDTLISLLRQIRAGYAQRPEFFPQSIVLCGVRDVRDYRLYQDGAEVITGGSAFNIKAKSLRMGNFTQEESVALWQQHTEATGQTFEEAIFSELWPDTEGQPWLVNALGHELTWENKAARDRSRHLTLADYREARERLIYSRATHLDQLSDKLREPRVHSVMSAIIGSKDELRSGEVKPDDVQYVADLGLIQARPSIRISNRIYQEVIPRELTWVTQSYIANQEQSWYVTPEHRLDMPKLLAAFQQFFREHSDIWSEGFSYKEAAPQLIMQAFLQRIINGGGRISREYGLGRKRTDLFIEWPTDPEQGMYGPLQRIVIELKIQRGSLDTVLAVGLEQTADYTARVGADEAHLIIFNRNPGTPWDEKIWQRQECWQDLPIQVWGA